MFRVGTLTCAFALAAQAGFAGSISAAPQEQPVMAPMTQSYDWSGMYAGGNIGAAWGYGEQQDVNGYNANNSFGYDLDTAFTGGLQAGYNTMIGNGVFGLEAELGYLGTDGSGQYPAYIGTRPGDSIASIKTKGYGAVSAHAGRAFDNVLVYGKFGLALAKIEASFVDPNPTGITLTSGTSASDIKLGYVLGAGVEYGLSDRWSARIEYSYMKFDSVKHTATNSVGGTNTFRHKASVQRLTAGVNYRF